MSLSDNIDNFKFAKNFTNNDGFDYQFRYLFKSYKTRSNICFVIFFDFIY